MRALLKIAVSAVSLSLSLACGTATLKDAPSQAAPAPGCDAPSHDPSSTPPADDSNSGPPVVEGGGTTQPPPTTMGAPPTGKACGAGTVVAAPKHAGGLIALPGPAPLGSEMLTNAGFETANGGGAAGWNAGPGFARDTSQSKSGGASFRLANANSYSYGQEATQPLQLKKGVYRISGWVKGSNLGSAADGSGVRLSLDFGSPNLWTERGTTGVLNGTFDWQYVELAHIVVPADRAGELKLEAYRGPGGTAWFDDVSVMQELPQPLDVFLLYPNYRGMMFEDQPGDIRLDVTVNQPDEARATEKVAVKLVDEASGAVIAAQEFPVGGATQLEAGLSGCAMQTGPSYLVKTSLQRADGSTVTEYPAYRVTRVPAADRAAMNVAFDDHNRVLMHGKPRFVLGVYDSGLGYGTNDQFWEDTLWSPNGDRRMGNLEINLYLNYWYGASPVGAMTSMMDNLQKHGVMYLQTGNCFANYGNDLKTFNIDTSDDYVKQLGAHPGLAGYYTADECDNAFAADTFKQYRRLAELDPGSMTFAALLGGPPDVYMWRDAVDLLSTDPYPMYGSEPTGGYEHGRVARWTEVTRDAVKNARPFLTVLQFFQFTSQGRWPTRQEMRNHAYMAIVEGARGLMWWSVGTNALSYDCGSQSVWCTSRQQHMADLEAVTQEIAGLEPALLADDVKDGVTNVSGADVRVRVKEANGKRYVFAYNNTAQQVTATLTLSQGGTANVIGEGRSVGAGSGSLTDAFGPWQAHVYELP